jgi:ABC-2 type transport system ATP-binding protein
MQQGTILLSGQRLRSSDIAFMPTEPYFYPYMKGKEYLDIVASTPQERQKSEKYCHYLELPLNELVDNYSTGMRKKLAFSAHFSLNKPVIILDEPYNGVDLEGNEVIKHIIKSNSETKTILLSSHILSTITDISHCIYHLNGPSDITAYSNENFGQLEQSLLDHMHHKMQF